MNYVIEATSVLGWWSAFHIGKSNLPEGPVSTAASGAIAGLVVAGVTIPNKGARQFPHTLYERKIIAPNRYAYTTLKLSACHAMFFTVYTGLRESVRRGRAAQGETLERDLRDIVSDFLAGGASGLCFRGGAMVYYKSPIMDPMLTGAAPKLLAGTFVSMGLACAVLESLDDYFVRSMNA